MPPDVHDLRIADRVREKLGRRGITVEEADQLLWNRPVFRTNPRAPMGVDRLFLIGVTNGGRRLTLVIEATADPTTWRVITGWDS